MKQRYENGSGSDESVLAPDIQNSQNCNMSTSERSTAMLVNTDLNDQPEKKIQNLHLFYYW